MGAWGFESSSNDGTMDILCGACKNIYEPTQEEANKCLEEDFNTEDSASSLGIVIWFLQQGMEVDQKYLTACLEEVFPSEMDSNDSGWTNFAARKRCLEIEKEMIESALNSGKAKKRYAKPIGDILSAGLGVVDGVRGENDIEEVNPTEEN